MQAPRPLKTAQNIPAEALERILARLPTNQERCGAACYMRSVVNEVDTMRMICVLSVKACDMFALSGPVKSSSCAAG